MKNWLLNFLIKLGAIKSLKEFQQDKGSSNPADETSAIDKLKLEEALKKVPTNICFAYYADDEFIGWYGGTFGGVSNVPKLYPNIPAQIDIVSKNFKHKIATINKTSFQNEKDKAETLGQTLSLLNFCSENVLRGKNIELRVVVSPFHDCENPLYDREAYRAFHKKDVIVEYKDLPIHLQIWVYADYSKVKEWAANTPTEFIQVIKAE